MYFMLGKKMSNIKATIKRNLNIKHKNIATISLTEINCLKASENNKLLISVHIQSSASWRQE